MALLGTKDFKGGYLEGSDSANERDGYLVGSRPVSSTRSATLHAHTPITSRDGYMIAADTSTREGFIESSTDVTSRSGFLIAGKYSGTINGFLISGKQISDRNSYVLGPTSDSISGYVPCGIYQSNISGYIQGESSTENTRSGLLTGKAIGEVDAFVSGKRGKKSLRSGYIIGISETPDDSNFRRQGFLSGETPSSSETKEGYLTSAPVSSRDGYMYGGHNYTIVYTFTGSARQTSFYREF